MTKRIPAGPYSRLLEIGIDAPSWPTAVPAEWSGFNLSDFWAWLRYFPAISDSRDLRLRAAWSDIDPHQKTILSDEMGVGFTTQLFAERLRFLVYADTQFVVRIMPDVFSLRPSSKRGPRKSPDYVALDAGLNFNVLECKGTQSSRAQLMKSVGDGAAQKSNLSARAGSRIRHSLVAGLFIPQSASPEAALLLVGDPEEDDVLKQLFHEDVEGDVIRIGVAQIGLAKHFALMGMPSLAGALARTRLVDGGRLTETGLKLRPFSSPMGTILPGMSTTSSLPLQDAAHRPYGGSASP